MSNYQSVTGSNTNDISFDPGNFIQGTYPSVGSFPGFPPMIGVEVNYEPQAESLAVENVLLKEENERLKLEVARLTAIVDLRRIVKELA